MVLHYYMVYVHVPTYCPVLLLVTVVMCSGPFPFVLLLSLLLWLYARTTWVKKL